MNILCSFNIESSIGSILALFELVTLFAGNFKIFSLLVYLSKCHLYVRYVTVLCSVPNQLGTFYFCVFCLPNIQIGTCLHYLQAKLGILNMTIYITVQYVAKGNKTQRLEITKLGFI